MQAGHPSLSSGPLRERAFRVLFASTHNVAEPAGAVGPGVLLARARNDIGPVLERRLGPVVHRDTLPQSPIGASASGSETTGQGDGSSSPSAKPPSRIGPRKLVRACG